MRKSYLIVTIVSVALGLIVLFLLLPTQPKSAVDKANSPIADSVKIQQAIELVNGPQPMQGIQMLLSMVEENPKNVEAHFVLGEFAIRSGQMEKAVARFNTIIELQPQNTLAYIYKGEALMQMDSLQAALATFSGAIATDSTSGIALVYAGKMNEQLGNWNEAKTLYQQILRHNEDPIVRDSVNAFIRKIDIKLKNK
jgi:tetratricopeptide (TPR) repeat protein